MLKLHQIDVASVLAAREAVGADVELMLDTNCPWTPAGAIAMARALAPYRLFWLEEPVWPPEDYDGPRARAPRPPTRRSRSARTSRRRSASARSSRSAPADILQPSITKVGGISEMKKIAALAQAAGLTVVPHSFYFGPGLAATLHVAATLRRQRARRVPDRRAGDAVPDRARSPRRTAGWRCPSGPGLGVEVNEEAIRRYPFVPAAAKPFVLT